MYVLLDANILLGYYLPRSISSQKAAARVRILIDSVRAGRSRTFLYVPNLVIAEVFSNFAKYSFGRYNRHVQQNGGVIDTRVYQSLRKQFQKDIHNGRIFYQLELNRYHVLAVDLVAPIDHNFKIRRKNKFVNPAGTVDQLLVGMGVHLAHVHGVDNVAILTADRRLTDLVTKCRSEISADTAQKLKLSVANDVAGKPFSKELFPKAFHLGACRDSELDELFGSWPLETKGRGKVYTFDG